MPLYDHACERCGRFSASRPLRAFDQPAPCPGCGASSPRAPTAPAVLGNAARRRRGPADGGYQRLSHASGCACCQASPPG
ncbi:FmdB family zinc ribbon protein [Ottowia sp.]|uniref:FmdB family zinc ribbon protein n=1 Tax=Ottowia sp. TaxID=1898956 RepID=UPI0039E2F4C7